MQRFCLSFSARAAPGVKQDSFWFRGIIFRALDHDAVRQRLEPALVLVISYAFADIDDH
jgi:hypothetical protein